MISTLLTTLLVIDSIVLILLIVVFQQGPEGGIGSTMGGGNSTAFFGASGGVKSIVRATWVSGALFFILATADTWVKTHNHYASSNSIQKMLQEDQGNSNQTIPSKPNTSPQNNSLKAPLQEKEIPKK